MTHHTLTTLSVALFITLGNSAIGGALSKADYKAAKEEISARYKVENSTCLPMAGNAKDICRAEVKGHEAIAKAELEEKDNSTIKHRYDVRIARSEMVYAVAKEKCDDLAGNTKDVCRKEAKAAYVNAKADAKVVEKASDARKDAATEKQNAAYAVAKEKCDAFAGDAKATCIMEAKALHGQL